MGKRAGQRKTGPAPKAGPLLSGPGGVDEGMPARAGGPVQAAWRSPLTPKWSR